RRSRRDQISFLKQHLVQITRDASSNLHATNRLDPADEISRLDDRLSLRPHHADWNRSRWLLGYRRIAESKDDKSNAKRSAHISPYRALWPSIFAREQLSSRCHVSARSSSQST